MKPAAIVLLMMLTLSTGCTRAVRVDIQAAPAADNAGSAKKFAVKTDLVDPANLQELQGRLDQNIETYLIVQGDKTLKPPYPLASGTGKPEAFAATVDVVRRELELRGFVYDETSPDFIVGIGMQFGHLDYEVAPIVHRGEQFGAARPVRPRALRLGTDWPTETHPPYQSGYTAQGGHAAATEATAILLQFSRPGGEQLWHGSAIAVGAYAQLDRMRSVLVEELLWEFPQPSGKPGQRLVPISE